MNICAETPLYVHTSRSINLSNICINISYWERKKNQYYRDEIYPRAIILVDMIKIVPARICLNHHISIRHRYIQVQIPSGGQT